MSADPAWRKLYRASGVCFLLEPVLLLIFFTTFYLLGVSTSAPTAEETLKSFPSRELAFYVPNVPLVLIAIFLVPCVLGLYTALKDVNRSYALLASAFGAVATTFIIALNALTFTTPGLSAHPSDGWKVNVGWELALLGHGRRWSTGTGSELSRCP